MKEMEIDLRPLWVPLIPTPYGDNALCLELCNSFPKGPADYQALIEWSIEYRAITPESKKSLLSRSKASPKQTAAALRIAAQIRHALFRIFTASAKQEEPAGEDLRLLERCLAQAFQHFRLSPSNADRLWSWDNADQDLEASLWPCLLSAAELLTSPLGARVRECGSETCEWLFLDLSHGRTRRWCDMQTCGNRAKAKRYHTRKTAGVAHDN